MQGDETQWMIIWNGNNKQTADLQFTMHGLYNFNGLQSTVTTLCDGGTVEPDQPTPDTPDTPDTPAEPDTPVTGITVKAKMPAHWTNTITAWVWADGMDGQVVTPTKDGEWYVVTENTTSLNIIFRNGTDWNGDANQTEDITGITTNTCYQLSQSGDSKATYQIIECEHNTPTDVDSMIVAPTSRKVLYNGYLYLILEDGRVYDVQGRFVGEL